jgi:hypothetical protein
MLDRKSKKKTTSVGIAESNLPRFQIVIVV